VDRPSATRELRELVRHRVKLVGLRSGLKAQVHAVLAKEGVLPAQGRMFGPGGHAQLDAMVMAENYTTRVDSLRDLIEPYDREVAMLEREIHRQLRGHRGYLAIQAVNGIGPTIAAILVAEIGDVAPCRVHVAHHQFRALRRSGRGRGDLVPKLTEHAEPGGVTSTARTPSPREKSASRGRFVQDAPRPASEACGPDRAKEGRMQRMLTPGGGRWGAA
jgi:hypothetical protein